MNQEKFRSLLKYQLLIQQKLEETKLPLKHQHREKSYKTYLKNELQTVINKIELIKSLGIKG